MNIPDVPDLRDGSTPTGVLLEPHGSIFMDFRYCVRTSMFFESKFTLRVLVDRNLVADLVFVRDALGVFPFVVLANKPGLSFLDESPIRFEVHVVQLVTVKN